MLPRAFGSRSQANLPAWTFRLVLSLAWWTLAGCGTIGVELKDLPFAEGDLDATAGEDPFPDEDDGGTDAFEGGSEQPTYDGGECREDCDGDSGLDASALGDGDAWPTVPEDGGIGSADAGHREDAGSGDAGGNFDDAATHDAGARGEDAGEISECELGAVPPAPMLHLRLDETSGLVASDAAGAHPGTLVDMGPSWTTGQLSGALGFDGVDDHVSLGNVGSARTIVLWVVTDSRGVTTDQTGFRFPAGTGNPANAWTNPGNAYSDNGLSAVSPALATASQDWSSFGFDVPSAVTGIEVLLDMQSNVLNLLASTSVTLSWNAGSSYTAACSSSQILSLGGSLYRCGGATHTWQRSWSASELSNQNFRARVTFSGVLGLNLDYLAVNVHYMPFTAGRSVLGLNASSRVTFDGQTLALTGLPAGTQVYTDAEAGALVGSGWHQIAIASPTPITMSNVLLGESVQGAPNFHGRMDDVRIYQETLSAEQIETLFERPACAP